MIAATVRDLDRIYYILARHHSKDKAFLKKIKLAMAEMEEAYPWRCARCDRLNKKIMNTCPTCHAHWSTGVKHNVQPRQRSAKPQRSQWQRWSKWDDQQWQSNQDYWTSQGNRSASRKRQDQAKGRSPSPRARKGKGGKGNKKGKDKDSEDSMAVPKAMQPFGGKTSTQWTTEVGETGSQSGSGGATSSGFQGLTPAQSYAQNQEYLVALKKAYPDAENTPDDIKALIERTEKDIAKNITTNIHANTRALSKAQKALSEAMDARKKHRAAWMEYLKEGLQAWEKSLDSYRRKQATLQEAAAKARQDIAMARKAIETNAKAAVDPMTLKAVPPSAVKEELEESAQDDVVDQEEEKLRSSLQGVLNACASSLGMQADTEKTPDPAQEISDSEDESRQAKRPRSKDAGERSLGS